MKMLPAILLACLALCVAAAAQELPKKYLLSQTGNTAFLADAAARPGITKLPDGVLYRVIASGNGEPVRAGSDRVTVSYKGYLIDGRLFDRNKPGKPAGFIVGRLIPGWSEVLLRMKEGDRWEVIVPADRAYGGGGAGAIPPDQTLIFLLQLDKVEHTS